MIHQFSRAELLSKSAKGGAAFLVAGSAFGVLAGTASADVYSDNDLAYLRLLIGVELLGADFYTNAISAQPFDGPGQATLKRALFNEGEHYASLAAFVTASGQIPATADDIDFAYPKDAFTTVASVTTLAVTLETLFLGAYLGAVDGVQSNALKQPLARIAVTLETLFLGAYLGAVDGVQAGALKQPLARIAANQAQHLTVFSELLGRKGFELSFPNPVPIDQASDALATYTA